jgi:hypothetical protein
MAAEGDRFYDHYVFMKRNYDDEYEIPPTVVAATPYAEDAVDIMMEAENDLYDEEKADVIRKMKLHELYMVNDDILVWKCRSKDRRLIIWSLRQYLSNRITDDFMEVWMAYRKYLDYIENCYDNHFELDEEEQALLLHHMPYQDFHFENQPKAVLKRLFNDSEDDEEMTSKRVRNNTYSDVELIGGLLQQTRLSNNG